MKTLNRIVLASGILGLSFLLSCVDEGLEFNPKDNENVEVVTLTDAYFEDTDDIVNMAMTGITDDGGRMDNTGDDRTSCAEVSYTGDKDAGTITINFGEGCTDVRGITRKGKITITYQGRRFIPGSSITTTFQNYFVNGFKVEGTRTLTNVTESSATAPKFSITLSNGKLTWPDGSFITRQSSHIREWVRGENPLSDMIKLTGSASGTNKDQREYEVEITKPLVFKRVCAAEKIYMAVEGTKELLVNSREITIDYGDGECDRVVTITVNGVTREITMRSSGQ